MRPAVPQARQPAVADRALRSLRTRYCLEVETWRTHSQLGPTPHACLASVYIKDLLFPFLRYII